MEILMMDSLIDISLPYFVYIIKTITVIIPINKNIQANTNNPNEGPSNISSGIGSGSCAIKLGVIPNKIVESISVHDFMVNFNGYTYQILFIYF